MADKMIQNYTPMCYAIYRSPQQDAEHDCASCPWDAGCMAAFQEGERQHAAFEKALADMSSNDALRRPITREEK